MNYQIPSTNNQIMTKISENSEPLGVWNLVIGYYLEFGIW
jgi:hypothetical protein